MSEELYKKYRPNSFKQVIGQDETVKTLVDLGKRGATPHCILFSGSSGCGKTTLARILRVKLGCGDADFCEMNAALSRGIDMVRDLQSKMGLAPINGKCRVWLLDEAHQLSSDAQASLLKILEDTPKHCYFMLATTDPQKLKPTVRTRCTEFKVNDIKPVDMTRLVKRVAEAEEIKIEDTVVERIVEYSEGSARKALVLLHAVIGLATEDEQLKAIAAADIKPVAFALAQMIGGWKKASWKEVAALLKGLVDEDPEGLRRMILSYAASILMSGKEDNKAALILEEFREPYFQTGKPGLVLSCWRVFH